MNLTEFKKLTIPERTRVFLAWVKTQNPEKEINYMDTKNCPLALFGKHITKRLTITARNAYFNIGNFLKPIYVIDQEDPLEKILRRAIYYGNIS